MPVTTTNIIVGACSSFKVGGNDIGGTSGGVQIEKKRTMTDIEADQVTGTVKKAVKKDTYTVKTTMLEATLQNLQIAWGTTSAPVVNAQTGATTLGLGIDTTTPENALTFVGPAPGGKTRTYTVNRAVSMVTGAHSQTKDKATEIPVEFECLPDLTQPAGFEYGKIVDQ